MNKKIPQIPIDVIIRTIHELLRKGIGEDFELEIYQRESSIRDETDKVTITLDFNIPHESLRND